MSFFFSNYEDYEAEPPELSTPEEDFDTLVIKPRFSAVSLLAAHQTYGKGDAHPDYAHMYVTDRTLRELACGTGRYGGQVVYRGIADLDRPYRFVIESFGERSTYDAVLSPASPVLAVPTDISQPRLGVTVRYISIGRPDTDAIGTNVVPPSPPDGSWDPPDNAFSGATDVILAYPDGWVLEKRTGPNIPGTELWMAEDVFAYYFEWRPRG